MVEQLEGTSVHLVRVEGGREIASRSWSGDVEVDKGKLPTRFRATTVGKT
jgi:hypothetical protein